MQSQFSKPSWNAMPAWLGSSCTAHMGIKDQENNFHANHRVFFLNTGFFKSEVWWCLEWTASQAAFGAQWWSAVVFHTAIAASSSFWSTSLGSRGCEDNPLGLLAQSQTPAAWNKSCVLLIIAEGSKWELLVLEPCCKSALNWGKQVAVFNSALLYSFLPFKRAGNTCAYRLV